MSAYCSCARGKRLVRIDGRRRAGRSAARRVQPELVWRRPPHRFRAPLRNLDGRRRWRQSGPRLPSIAQSDLALAPRWPAFSPDGTQDRVLRNGRIAAWRSVDTRPRHRSLGEDHERPGVRRRARVVAGRQRNHLLVTARRQPNAVERRPDASARPGPCWSAAATMTSRTSAPTASASCTRTHVSALRLLRQDIETGREAVLHESRLALGRSRAIARRRIPLHYSAPSQPEGFSCFTLPVSGGSSRDDHLRCAALTRPTAMGTRRPLAVFLPRRHRQHRTAGSRPRRRPDRDRCSRAGPGTWPTARLSILATPEYCTRDSTVKRPSKPWCATWNTAIDENFFATLEYPRWSRDGRLVTGSLFTNQRFPGDIAVCVIADQECRTIAEAARIPDVVCRRVAHLLRTRLRRESGTLCDQCRRIRRRAKTVRYGAAFPARPVSIP